MSGLQNARNLNGLGLLVCFLVFMASFAIAFIPSRDADPVHVRAARVVVVVTGIGTWLLFKRAQRLRPSEADQPPLDEGGTASEDMASPLEDLGVPLDGSVTDPQTALMGGVVKAGLYQAQLSLEAGDPDGALSILESLLEPAVGLEVPGLSEAHGVAFFLKGQALEKKASPTGPSAPTAGPSRSTPSTRKPAEPSSDWGCERIWSLDGTRRGPSRGRRPGLEAAGACYPRPRCAAEAPLPIEEAAVKPRSTGAWLCSILCVLLLAASASAEKKNEETPKGEVSFSGPDFKTVLSLGSTGGPKIAPDGTAVLFSVREADWEDNRFDTEIWLARGDEEPFPLTRTKAKSSSDASWSPDGKRVAFLADRGDDTQIWWISANGGEAVPVTAVEDGVSGFQWSPDGAHMAIAITDRQDPDRKKLEETYGGFAVEDQDFRNTHLWLLDVEAALAADGGAELPSEKEGDEDEEADEESEEEDDDDELSPFRRLTAGSDFTVHGFRWSPDGRLIAFDHTPDSRVESFSHTDISVVEVDSGEVRPLVTQPGPDSGPRWSPDGAWVLFATGDGDPTYYLNTELARVPAGGGEPVVLTEAFDENPSAVAWLDDGIRFLALDRTTRGLYRLDPDSREIEPVRVEGAPRIIWSVDYSKDGRTLAFQGEGTDTLREVYRVDPGSARAQRLSRSTEQTEGWSVGNREVIEWESKDGAKVEGVLLTPEGFDPAVKHPLLVIIHGGPSWLSFPVHAYTYVYPVQQWLEKGAVILMPNYRGSAGYGEAFRSLNVRNLGVGDAWDVLSGVEHLVARGFIDPERMGSMGWSQGGYISAFLTTSSDRFAAISVGAGISNWMTYYVNTDIHPFTRHYLKGTPWSDPEVYAKTSPMTYINEASTPTLIQHGELDRRVPTPNAYELYQGLQDVGVPVELVIYKGFGHGISKPKELLGAVWHNWQFFAKWIWGEEVEIPAE